MTAHTPTKDLLPRLQHSASHAFTPLQREFNRMFEQLGEGWESFAAFRMAPCMDAVETKHGLEVTLELPGLSRKDVTITVDGDALTVSGDKKADQVTKRRAFRLGERSYGEFSRSIYLPRSVDGGKIKATMADGVLKITAPRRSDAETKTIPIEPV